MGLFGGSSSTPPKTDPEATPPNGTPAPKETAADELAHTVEQAKALAKEALAAALGKPEVERELDAIAVYVMDRIREAAEGQWPPLKFVDGVLQFGEKAIETALENAAKRAAEG